MILSKGCCSAARAIITYPMVMMFPPGWSPCIARSADTFVRGFDLLQICLRHFLIDRDSLFPCLRRGHRNQRLAVTTDAGAFLVPHRRSGQEQVHRARNRNSRIRNSSRFRVWIRLLARSVAARSSKLFEHGDLVAVGAI